MVPADHGATGVVTGVGVGVVVTTLVYVQVPVYPVGELVGARVPSHGPIRVQAM